MPGSWPYPCAFSKLISLSSNLPQFLNSRPDLNSFPVEPGSCMSAFLPNPSWVAEISLGRTVRWLRVICKSVFCLFFSIITCLPSWVLRDNLWNYAWVIVFSLDLLPQGTLPCLKADNILPRDLCCWNQLQSREGLSRGWPAMWEGLESVHCHPLPVLCKPQYAISVRLRWKRLKLRQQGAVSGLSFIINLQILVKILPLSLSPFPCMWG